jgi:hypothetical protein
MGRQPVVISTRTTINHAATDEWVPAQRAGARPRTRLRAAIEELPPETIEAIAQRVADLLRTEPATHSAPRLVDAGQLARQLGLTRAWVYEHAGDLGAIRLGDGPKARLRFNPATAANALADVDDSPAPATRRAPTATRGRPRREPAPSGPLLPIRGQNPSAAGVPPRPARRNRQGGRI